MGAHTLASTLTCVYRYTAPASTGKSYAALVSTAILHQRLQVNDILNQRLHHTEPVSTGLSYPGPVKCIHQYIINYATDNFQSCFEFLQKCPRTFICERES